MSVILRCIKSNSGGHKYRDKSLIIRASAVVIVADKL